MEEVIEGLIKWAVLSVGCASPESETISSFLVSTMDPSDFSIKKMVKFLAEKRAEVRAQGEPKVAT
jgi:hypothetical protein